MTGLSKTKVKTDIRKNRLYITLPTSVNTKELEKIYSDIRFGIADLKPGFDVITDLSKCSVGHLSAVPLLWKISSYLTAHQVGRVVRVVGNMGLILKQLIALSIKFQCYKPVYVLTMEEAEEELRCPIKPDGLRFQLHDKRVEYQVNEQQIIGAIIDISTSGCAIRGKSDNLSTGMSLPVAFELGNKEGALSSYCLKAKVVRVHNDMFAIQFTEMDDAQKRQLYESLTYELDNKG
jgi:hypothetical protein